MLLLLFLFGTLLAVGLFFVLASLLKLPGYARAAGRGEFRKELKESLGLH